MLLISAMDVNVVHTGIAGPGDVQSCVAYVEVRHHLDLNARIALQLLSGRR